MASTHQSLSEPRAQLRLCDDAPARPRVRDQRLQVWPRAVRRERPRAPEQHQRVPRPRERDVEPAGVSEEPDLARGVATCPISTG